MPEPIKITNDDIFGLIIRPLEITDWVVLEIGDREFWIATDVYDRFVAFLKRSESPMDNKRHPMRNFTREYIQHVNAELRLRGIKVVGKIHHNAETCYVCVSARLHDAIRRELGRQAGETLDRILKDAIDQETE